MMEADEPRPNNPPPTETPANPPAAPARHWGRPFGWIAFLLLLGFVLTVLVASVGVTGPGLFGLETSIIMLATGAFVLGVLFLTTLMYMRSAMRRTAHRINALEERAAILDRELTLRAQRLESQIGQVRDQAFVQIADLKDRAPEPAIVATTEVVVPAGSVGGLRPVEHPVIAVDGVGDVFARRLGEIGIEDTGQLARSDPRSIAQRLDVNENTVDDWRAQSDLLRLPAMTPHLAHLLVDTGTRSVNALARLGLPEAERRLSRGRMAADYDRSTLEECLREARQMATPKRRMAPRRAKRKTLYPRKGTPRLRAR